MRIKPTKLGIGVGGVRVDGVLDGLVVGLDRDLVLAGTALVLVVLEVAGGDVLSAHFVLWCCFVLMLATCSVWM